MTIFHTHIHTHLLVSNLAPPILIGSSSFLQVTRTAIKAWMGSKFGKIDTGSVELAAIERLGKYPYL